MFRAVELVSHNFPIDKVPSASRHQEHANLDCAPKRNLQRQMICGGIEDVDIGNMCLLPYPIIIETHDITRSSKTLISNVENFDSSVQLLVL